MFELPKFEALLICCWERFVLEGAAQASKVAKIVLHDRVAPAFVEEDKELP
jgi:hypothetical protein